MPKLLRRLRSFHPLQPRYPRFELRLPFQHSQVVPFLVLQAYEFQYAGGNLLTYEVGNRKS